VQGLDFLAIGHVTHDLLPGGRYMLGGSAAYAGVTAQRLGLCTAVLTSVPNDLDLKQCYPQISWHVVPSTTLTTFENIYDGARRQQVVHSLASPLAKQGVPEALSSAELILLCPVAQEVDPDWARMPRRGLLGVAPQGWMRVWDQRGQVTARPWVGAEEILPRVDVLFVSEQDLNGDGQLIERYAHLVRIMAVTRAERAVSLHADGRWREIATFVAHEVDPTGAGDVFAAAFLTELQNSGDAGKAAVFANAAASLAVEGVGLEAIPTRDQVDERLRTGLRHS